MWPITFVAPEKDATDFWSQSIQSSRQYPPTSRDTFESITKHLRTAETLSSAARAFSNDLFPRPSMARTARTSRIGLLALFQHHPSKVCHNVSHQHEPFFRNSHQDQIGEHLRNPGCDVRQIGLFALQMARQHVVDFAMQATGQAHSLCPDQCCVIWWAFAAISGFRSLAGRSSLTPLFGSLGRRASCCKRIGRQINSLLGSVMPSLVSKSLPTV
jgi:hypothetical protein